jgi:hypothetical protein
MGKQSRSKISEDKFAALMAKKVTDVETLAKEYHEICREMANNGIGMITKPTQPYIEWDQLTEDQKNGRRFIAEKVLLKWDLFLK